MPINCKLCGKEFKNKIQYRHLMNKHNMTVKDYENIYGKGSSDLNFSEPNIPNDEKVECKICNDVFKNQITNSHLKSHGISVNHYRETYGNDSLYSKSYRNNKSKNSKGTNNPNYGNVWSDEKKYNLSNIKKEGYKSGKYVPYNLGISMSEEQKEKQSLTMKKKYEEGELVPYYKGLSIPDNIKEKISESVKKYAKHNHEELSNRAKKAKKTFLENGHVPFNGYRHSKEKYQELGEQLVEINKNKRKEAIESKKKFIENEGYTIHDISDNTKGYVEFTCNCGSNNIHRTTIQLFNSSKYVPYDGIFCRFCDVKSNSRGEMEIGNYIENLGIKIIRNYRSVIYPHEIDIYVPACRLAIEFNGLYWHSELSGKDKNYHLKKLEKCEESGVTLIQIFEDEWYNSPDIIKSIIKQKLNITYKKIFARKTIVKEIDTKTAKEFIEKNHIGGYHKSSYKYGLFYNDELVSVMTFSKGNTSRKSYDWEIDRFCTKKDYNIVGGASKLFSCFKREVNPETVVTYADRRYGTGTVYKNLGFTFEKSTVPNYWYFKDHLIRYHRFGLRKGIYDSDDLYKTEWDNRQIQGWNRIWDCGSNKYVFHNVS